MTKKIHYCQHCHKRIPSQVHPYTLRLELFPAVEPSLEISDEDMKLDFEAEMKRLIDLMESMNEAEVRHQEELMFVSYSFTLCPDCRDRLSEQLKRLHPPRQ